MAALSGRYNTPWITCPASVLHPLYHVPNSATLQNMSVLHTRQHPRQCQYCTLSVCRTPDASAGAPFTTVCSVSTAHPVPTRTAVSNHTNRQYCSRRYVRTRKRPAGGNGGRGRDL
eukprot:2395059-Rhodomonas_salina.1